MEFVFGGEASVNETMSWAGVNQSLEGMVGNIIGVEQYYERIRWKSGHIEFDLISAWRGSTQSSTHTEGGLLSIFFLSPWPVWCQTSHQTWWLGPLPSRLRMRLLNKHMLCNHLCCRRGKNCCPFVIVALVGSACCPFQVWKKGQVCYCCWRSWQEVVQSCLFLSQSCFSCCLSGCWTLQFCHICQLYWNW